MTTPAVSAGRARFYDADPDGVAILGAVVLGTLAGRAGPPVTGAATLVVAVPLAIVLLVRRPRGRALTGAGLLTVILLATTAAAVTAGRAAGVRGAVLPALAGEGGTVTVEGTVVAEPRRLRSGGLGVTLGVERVTTPARSWRTRERAGLVLPARTPAGTPRLGDRLVIRGGVVPARRGDPLGRVPVVELRRIGVLARTPARSPALVATERVRADARRIALATLPAERAGLLTGLGIGDTSILPGDVEAAFEAAGLTHLVAVSGANVAIVLAAGLWPLLLAGAGRPAVAVAGTAIIAMFVFLTRWEPSVLRAGVMATLVLTGLAAGRGPGGRRALCLAASLLLLADPALSGSIGFILSVAATAGVLWAGPAVSALLPGWLPERVRGAVGVALGAQSGAFTVLAIAGAGVPAAAVAANLLVLPIAAAPMLLGLLVALTAPVAPALAALACTLAEPFLAALVAIARWAATLPGAGADGATGPARVVLPVLLLTLVAAGHARRMAAARAAAETRVPGHPP